MKLTQERLKELLHYEPETGIFTRLKSSGGMKSGDIAGGTYNQGYRTIWIDGKHYNASRLAWLYMEGYLPEHDMDHKNRIRNDDRWENLRHVSRQCNCRNSGIQKNNKSGIIGVCWFKRDQKWRAYIKPFNKCIHLGYFDSKLDAAKVRWQAEVRCGFPNCNTVSSAYLYLQQKGAT